MAKSFNYHSHKYLFYLCIFFLIQSMFVKTNEHIISILFQFPSNVIHWAFMSAYILLVTLYYIHSILDYIVLEDEIKVRLQKRYSTFLLKRTVISFIWSCFVLILYLLILNISFSYIGKIVFVHLLGWFIFLCTALILKKKQHQFILIINLILVLLCRYMLTLWI